MKIETSRVAISLTLVSEKIEARLGRLEWQADGKRPADVIPIPHPGSGIGGWVSVDFKLRVGRNRRRYFKIVLPDTAKYKEQTRRSPARSPRNHSDFTRKPLIAPPDQPRVAQSPRPMRARRGKDKSPIPPGSRQRGEKRDKEAI
jgi:hypothetical protein